MTIGTRPEAFRRRVGGFGSEEAEMASGNVESIADLFIRYGEQMKRRARIVLGSDADAEDAVQEVMLTLLDAPSVLDTVDRVGAWLLAAVRGKAIDIIRSAVRRREREATEGVEEIFSGVENPEDLMGREEVAELVADAVDDLPPSLRYAFVANALDGLTFREMSVQTGVPMGTLMARKKKAVDAIRARLRRERILS